MRKSFFSVSLASMLKKGDMTRMHAPEVPEVTPVVRPSRTEPAEGPIHTVRRNLALVAAKHIERNLPTTLPSGARTSTRRPPMERYQSGDDIRDSLPKITRIPELESDGQRFPSTQSGSETEWDARHDKPLAAGGPADHDVLFHGTPSLDWHGVENFDPAKGRRSREFHGLYGSAHASRAVSYGHSISYGSLLGVEPEKIAGNYPGGYVHALAVPKDMKIIRKIEGQPWTPRDEHTFTPEEVHRMADYLGDAAALYGGKARKVRSRILTMMLGPTRMDDVPAAEPQQGGIRSAIGTIRSGTTRRERARAEGDARAADRLAMQRTRIDTGPESAALKNPEPTLDRLWRAVSSLGVRSDGKEYGGLGNRISVGAFGQQKTAEKRDGPMILDKRFPTAGFATDLMSHALSVAGYGGIRYDNPVTNKTETTILPHAVRKLRHLGTADIRDPDTAKEIIALSRIVENPHRHSADAVKDARARIMSMMSPAAKKSFFSLRLQAMPRYR
jgi:hypothetical protein